MQGMQGEFRLGVWLVQPNLARVSKDGATVHLRAKVMDLLVFLAARPGEVVSKDALLNGVWGTEFISESALTRVVTELRHALGDDVDHPAILETIPKRGYRLIAPVEPLVGTPAPEAVAPAAAVSVAQGFPGPSPVEGGRLFSPAFVARRPWLWTAGLLIVLAAGALVVMRRGAEPHGTPATSGGPPVIKSVAVLPLRNLTRDSQEDWFAEALTEELTSALSQISAVRVISGISARHYKGTDKTAAEIARELGDIEILLSGSVERDGDRMRAVVYLDEVASNRRVWTHAYDRALGHSLNLFNEVARSVALEIGAALTTEEDARLTRRRALNPDAYQAYLQGLYFLERRQAGGCVPAERYFQQAIARDPSFAEPHAELAFCYAFDRLYGQLEFSEAAKKASQEVARAFALDERLASAHRSLALIKHRLDFDWTGAERSFRRAVELNPGDVDSLFNYGELLYASGRGDEGLGMIRRGLAFVPFHLGHNVGLGFALYNLRRYDEAIDQLQKTLELDPHWSMARFWLAESYAARGRHDAAVTEYLEWLRQNLVTNRMLAATDALASAYKRSGWDGFWRKELDLAEEENRQPGTLWQLPYDRTRIPYLVARRYARLGDRDRAVASLEKAYAQRSYLMVFLNVEPLFDILRSDPRFQDLVRRVGLKP